MRQLVSTALVAVVVSLVTVTAAGALAQAPAQDPSADRSLVTAGLNADTVDGKHAVGAKASIAKRKNRLVATNKTGYLPSNIVRPLWGLIEGMPTGFADGVDDTGIDGLTVTVKSATTSIDPGGVNSIAVQCPDGSQMVAGGHYASEWAVHNVASYPFFDGWRASFQNTNNAIAADINAYAICLSTEPAGNITPAGKVVTAKLPKRGM